MLARIESSIRDYVSEGADISYEQLVRRFGTPEEIVLEHICAMDTDELMQNLCNKRKVIAIASLAVTLTMIMWLSFLALCYADFSNSINGTLVDEGVSVVERIEFKKGDG